MFRSCLRCPFRRQGETRGRNWRRLRMARIAYLCSSAILLCPAWASPDEAAEGRSRKTPMLAMPVEGVDDWETEISWFREFGANTAFLKGRDRAKQEKYRALGFETVAMPPTLSRNARRGKGRQDWITSYLKSPWQQKGSAPISFSLAIPIPKPNRVEGSAYVFADHLPLEQALFIQERGTREFLSREQWTVDLRRQSVTVHGGNAGKTYRMVFLCGERFRREQMNIDGIPPTGRAAHRRSLGRWLQRMPDLSVVRATSLNYSFSIIRPAEANRPAPFIPSRSWYGYQRTTTPDRLNRFAKRHGHPFDIRTMIDTCYFEESYVPDEEMWRWIDLVRADMRGYAQDYADQVHKSGKKLRLFWGDQWIGMEPYLGDVDATSIDEVSTALQGPPGRVRDLMAFPGKAKRLCRFTLSRGKALKNSEDHAAQVRGNWRRWKREMLLGCPDGFEYLAMPRDWIESPAGDAYREVMHDFQKVFQHVHGSEPHRTMKICVLNAWGPMRGWGRFSGYASRDVISNMVDWPVQIEWVSFADVARNGVPSDADVVVISGEPNTSFGGGVSWRDAKLTTAIKKYVHRGGGLCCIGGASYLDGRFALGELLGVRYAGPPTQNAADELWSANRWSEAGRPANAYDATLVTPEFSLVVDREALPDEVASRFHGTTVAVRADCLVAATSGKTIASATDEPVVWTLGKFGAGRTCYLAGYGDYSRFLKVVLHYVGRKITELDQLDTGDPDVPVYLYPQERLLIAFRASGTPVKVRIRFDPDLVGLGHKSRIALRPTSGGASLVLSPDEARSGFELELRPGETRYWKVEASR